MPFDALSDLNTEHKPWPSVIENNLTMFIEFQLNCRIICQELLAALSTTIITNGALPFESSHRDRKLSTSSLAMLKYPPTIDLDKRNTGHMAHTDVGSLTLLFTYAPGLEIYRASTSTWVSVPPQPGCALVNVGDTLSFLSGMQLKSCLHIVVPVEGHVRFSLAYFHRPELEAQFVDGSGRRWTGEAWHRAKYQTFRAENVEQSSTSLLTGRYNFLGHVENEEDIGSQSNTSDT